MADTYGKAFYHVVFSTKNRHPWLDSAEKQKRSWGYIEAVIRDCKCASFVIGGMPEHLHILFDLLPSVSLSQVIKQIKGTSSVWIKQNLEGCENFRWQDGYSYFVVSEPLFPKLKDYILNQPEHHKVVTFQDEYRTLLNENNTKYDEKYLWDDN